MKAVFMGTPEFALPTLQSLARHHEILAVVTQPDKRKGRGNKVQFSPVKSYALEQSWRVFQPIKIRDPESLAHLEQYCADVFVVVAYGQILTKPLLNLPKFGCINVHGSLLPQYRGAAPIQRAIINGETKTGVTTMFMDVELDAGDMILRRELLLTPEDDSASVHKKLSLIGADTLIETLSLLESGKFQRIPQDHSQATYAPMIRKNTGAIPWDAPAQNIVNLIRGLSPQPGAYLILENTPVKVWKAECVNWDAADMPGTILESSPKKGLVVAAGKDAVLITGIQAQNGKKMTAMDYLKGHAIPVGTLLSIPQKTPSTTP